MHTFDSFSIIHTIAYSTVAIQELNLAYHYPAIFWNTACLIVDSAGLQDEDEEDSLESSIQASENSEDDDSDEDDEEEDMESKKTSSKNEKIKKPKKVVNYGKISSAIGKMKQFGIAVVPPDINRSKYTFVRGSSSSFSSKSCISSSSSASFSKLLF